MSENQKIIWHLPSVLFSRHTNPFTVSVSMPNYTLHSLLTSQIYRIFFWSYGEKKNKWTQYQLTSEVYSTFKMQVHCWLTYQYISCAILYAIDMSFPPEETDLVALGCRKLEIYIPMKQDKHGRSISLSFRIQLIPRTQKPSYL